MSLNVELLTSFGDQVFLKFIILTIDLFKLKYWHFWCTGSQEKDFFTHLILTILRLFPF